MFLLWGNRHEETTLLRIEVIVTCNLIVFQVAFHQECDRTFGPPMLLRNLPRYSLIRAVGAPVEGGMGGHPVTSTRPWT